MTPPGVKRVYEISVAGRLPDELLAELGADVPVRAPAGTVLMAGHLDQNELQRVAALIADLGLSLRELRVLPDG